MIPLVGIAKVLSKGRGEKLVSGEMCHIQPQGKVVSFR